MFHRPVLDRVLELEPRTRGRGLRNVPSTLDVFDSHFPRFPVLPGVVVLDSLAELARLVLPGAPEAWRLGGIGRTQFRHYVRPGDQLLLDVTIEQLAPRSATLSGEARVAGRLVARARQIRLVREERPL
jgi:3-hydroxyacyl-[acyl-carrier-protein] dehydratase